MVQPIQYQIPGVLNPFENVLSGLKLGAQMADIDAARQQQQAAIQLAQQKALAEQAKIAQQQQMQQTLAEFSAKPNKTFDDYQKLSLFLEPQAAKNLMESFATKTKADQDREKLKVSQYANALAINPQIAIDMMNKEADDFEAAGDALNARMLRDSAKLAEQNPERVRDAMLSTYGPMFGKDWTDATIAASAAPTKLAQDKVTLANAEQELKKRTTELKYLDAQKQAELNKAQTDAQKSAIEAKYAEKIANADLAFKAAQTAAQKASAAASGASMALTQQQTLKLKNDMARGPLPEFNAQMGGFVVAPTASNPQGGFIPLNAAADSKQQRTAVQSLKTAGYDPVTGEDNITRLIKKSTGSTLGMLTDEAYRFIGASNDGMKAIGQLEPIAKQMALDLLDGKLGAGIANADRDFIVSTLGDISNPRRTEGEKLAAWNSAKNRMVVSGMIPPPQKVKPEGSFGTPATTGQGGPAMPPGFKRLN